MFFNYGKFKIPMTDTEYRSHNGVFKIQPGSRVQPGLYVDFTPGNLKVFGCLIPCGNAFRQRKVFFFPLHILRHINRVLPTRFANPDP